MKLSKLDEFIRSEFVELDSVKSEINDEGFLRLINEYEDVY